jgi:hypothetical protein
VRGELVSTQKEHSAVAPSRSPTGCRSDAMGAVPRRLVAEHEVRDEVKRWAGAIAAYPQQVDARVAAQRWCETWERAWRGHDHGDIAALYADDAVLEAHAARRPENYIEPTLAVEHSIECEFDEPLVDGDRAAAAWRAELRLEPGRSEQLAGVSLLRFDTAGLVVHQLDFWARGL